MIYSQYYITSRVEIDARGCWNWTRHVDRHGYAQVGNTLMHRASYQAFKGAIPAGLTIDHLCRNRRCLNPAHMETVSKRVNTLRGISPAALNAVKTHCKRGHALTGRNLYLYKGMRVCRKCNVLRSLAYKRSRK